MDITELSLVKSSTGIAKLFAEELKTSVLNSETESLASSPASFVSLILSGIGDLSANSYLEQQMIKREMHKNTAIKLQSLLRYLSDEELANIFATPSSSSFFIALPYNLVLNNAVIDPSLGNNIKKVRINKDSSIVLMNKTIFILDYSINIVILNSETENPTFNVSYDMTDRYSDTFTSIKNPYINNRILNYEGVKYIGFEVLAREYDRKTTILNINTDSMGDQLISYDNQLMGFEVLYRESANNSYRKLTGYPEGVDPVDGYNYSLIKKNNINYIKISFSKSSSNFNVGNYSTLKITTYTTSGIDGNVSFPDLDQDLANNLQFILKPDTTNVFEQAIATLTPLVTTRSTESTGGKNQMSFEEIRSYVINKSSNNLTVTPNELERKAKEFNCDIEKIRHDILMLMYRINTILSDGSDYISSGMGVFKFNLDDINYRNEIKSRILKPTDIFKYNSNDTYYHHQVNKMQLVNYLADYRLNQYQQVSFPFFIKMYFGDTVSAKVFNMAMDKDYFTEIDYYDDYALDTINIEKVNFYRNPSIENPTKDDIEDGYEGLYTISFTAIVGKNLLNMISSSIEDTNIISPLKFKIAIFDKKNNENYFTDCVISSINTLNSSIKVKATLVTNNNINENNNICINQNSLTPIPIPLIYESFFYINSTVEMKVLVIYNSETMYQYRNMTYDKYLTEKEQNEKYYISTVYTLGEISLLEDYSNKFNFTLDIKLNDQNYERYEKDIFATYSETEYERDKNGLIVYEDKTITNDLGDETTIRIPKVLHQKGEIVKDNTGNPIIQYKKGDIIYKDERPVEKEGNSYYCLIKTIPWFDRLFNVPNKYFDILKSYLNLIEVHNSLSQTIIDGVELSLGLKRTSGNSNVYYIKNKVSEKEELIDNIAISLSLGVAFSSILDTDSKEYNVKNIVSKTKEYIYNLSSDTLSMSDLIIYLKNQIPSIEYIEFYSINNYDANQCQSIHKNTNSVDAQSERLCIKMDIDEENSDFNEGIISFVPAINVKVL